MVYYCLHQRWIKRNKKAKPLGKKQTKLTYHDHLCPIFLGYVRKEKLCWLHYALLPHSGPLNWILPDIEFSFEHRGSKSHLYFPSRSVLTSKHTQGARADGHRCCEVSNDHVKEPVSVSWSRKKRRDFFPPRRCVERIHLRLTQQWPVCFPTKDKENVAAF